MEGGGGGGWVGVWFFLSLTIVTGTDLCIFVWLGCKFMINFGNLKVG